MASKTPDELRRLAAEREAAEEAERLKQQTIIGQGIAPIKPSESDVKFASSAASYEKGWKAITNAYAEQNDGKGPDKNGALAFPSLDAAIKFFTEQAVLGHKFCGTRVNHEGKPIEPNFHVFSCGDGKLYQGSYAEITALLKGSAKTNPAAAAGLADFKAMVPEPTPAPNTASTLREQLQQGRQQAAAQQEDPVATPTASPNN